MKVVRRYYVTLLFACFITIYIFLGCGEEIDTEPPSAPVGLQIQQTEDEMVLLTWAANKEQDLAGYNVYRSINKEGEYVRLNYALIPESGSPSYQDSNNLSFGEMYYYVITAVDESGNESNYSYEANIILRFMIQQGKWDASGNGEFEDGDPGMIKFNFSVSDDRLSLETDKGIRISKGRELPERWSSVFFIPTAGTKVTIQIIGNGIFYEGSGLTLEGLFNSKTEAQGTWKFYYELLRPYFPAESAKGTWTASYISQ